MTSCPRVCISIYITMFVYSRDWMKEIYIYADYHTVNLLMCSLNKCLEVIYFEMILSREVWIMLSLIHFFDMIVVNPRCQ